MPCFSASQRCFMSTDCSVSSDNSTSSAPRRSLLAASVSFESATFSICNCMMRRSTTSISVGIESISIRNLLAASSIRSIALSGKNRLVRYRLESIAALTNALS